MGYVYEPTPRPPEQVEAELARLERLVEKLAGGGQDQAGGTEAAVYTAAQHVQPQPPTRGEAQAAAALAALEEAPAAAEEPETLPARVYIPTNGEDTGEAQAEGGG